MKQLSLILGLFLLTGISCLPTSHQMTTSTKNEWEHVSQSFSRRDFSVALDERTVSFTVYRVDSSGIRTNLIHSNEPKRFEEWISQIDNNSILFNGGYFDDSYEPTGSVILNGKEKGANSYDSESAGYLLLKDGDLSIQKSLPQDRKGLFAVQSFPYLIYDGLPVVKKESGQAARRTIVAEDGAGMFYVVIFDRSTITLYQASQILDQTLNLTTALNLDGGTSTGFAARFDDFSETYIPLVALPQVIVLSENLEDQLHDR